MADWVITKTDNLESLTAQLSDAHGPIDLQPGTTVTFVGVPNYQLQPDGSQGALVNIGGGATVVRPGATVDDPNRGFVSYDLSDQDIANAGVFRCIWMVLPPSQSKAQAFPQDSNMILLIKGNP